MLALVPGRSFLGNTPFAGWAPAPHRKQFPFSIGQEQPPRPKPERVFHLEKLPSSILIAAVGGAGMVVAKSLPKPLNTVATVGGFLGIGYALYNLFSRPPLPPGTEAGPVDPESSVPTPKAKDLDLVHAVINWPPLNSDQEEGILSDDYEVKITWYNDGPTPVVFDWDFQVIEEGIGFFGGLGAPSLHEVPMGKLSLPANRNYGPMAFDLDRESWGVPGYTQGYVIKLIARKIYPDGTKVPAASTKFFLDVGV